MMADTQSNQTHPKFTSSDKKTNKNRSNSSKP
ncbi:protein of unknown function [Xenorhabdus nematophila AN6/1]|nr:hypothetical protein XNA1_2220013 [Xenorhabdus nematophila str. Anatoliense]CEK22908.1 protein of unknown function [Xenorhabdus nematophila AN6/1]